MSRQTTHDIRYDGQDYAEWLGQIEAQKKALLLTVNSLAYGRPELLTAVTKQIDRACAALDERKK